jgi:probable HAF family extracellular repeat protein
MSRSVRWLSILGALLISAPVLAADLYSVSDLGGLGSPRGSGASALNGSGDAVGYSFVASSGYVHAVLNHKGTISDLGTLGGTQSLARSVNLRGDIVGWAYPAGASVQHAVLWSGGQATDLGTLGGTVSDAHDVNDLGIVVGSSLTAAGNERAFWWDGTLHDLGTLGGSQSRAYAVSNWGDIVGFASPASNIGLHAFYAKPGSPLYDLGTLGGLTSHAYDVNELGHVCGWSQIAGDPAQSRGFYWANGVMKTIGTLGGNYSAGLALNDNDEVVGMSAREDGSYAAFLWKNGQITDLNSLLPGGTHWTLVRAWDIDEHGVIVGEGLLDGQARAFVLEPANATAVPPSALPTEVRFAGSRPNPVAGSAHFDFELPALSRAHLELYDLTGRRVREIADGWFPPGRTSLSWDGLDASGARPAAGLYWASLTIDGRRWTKAVAITP